LGAPCGANLNPSLTHPLPFFFSLPDGRLLLLSREVRTADDPYIYMYIYIYIYICIDRYKYVNIYVYFFITNASSPFSFIDGHFLFSSREVRTADDIYIYTYIYRYV